MNIVSSSLVNGYIKNKKIIISNTVILIIFKK